MMDVGWTEEKRKRVLDAARADLEGKLWNYCPKLASQYDPTGTGPGVTPGDMFRANYVAASLGHPPPPNLASMYILLCGAETQGVGFTRLDYDRFRNAVGKDLGTGSGNYTPDSVTGIPLQDRSELGIDPWTQRRMWSLIKAIMAASKNPEESRTISVHGDGGRSAFALLQDIVRIQFFAGKWTKRYATYLSRALGSFHNRFTEVGTETAHLVYLQGTCGQIPPGYENPQKYNPGSYMVLEEALERSQRSWQAQLGKYFCVPGTAKKGEPCLWRSVASPSQLAALKLRPKNSVLVLSSATTAKLVGATKQADVGQQKARDAVEAEEKAQKAEKARAANTRKALVATGTVVAGFGAFVGARRLAK
jgi:hypothetical protein